MLVSAAVAFNPALPFDHSQMALPMVLLKVAQCESGLTQFNPDGSVIHGKVHPPDTGIFMINRAVHQEEADRMGLDLDTVEGNTKFALYLYYKNGLKDWEPSKSCWSKNPVIDV